MLNYLLLPSASDRTLLQFYARVIVQTMLDLKRSLQNFLKISNKCLISTISVFIYVADTKVFNHTLMRYPFPQWSVAYSQI